ncbi:MAG: alpha-L-rhamnosidase N-terminal domain-containing protein [Opitutales bacterium]
MSALPVPRNLLTDFLANPIGLDHARPRLTWALPASAPFSFRLEVRAAGDPHTLTGDQAPVWSRVVDPARGDDPAGILYDGEDPGPGRRIWWTARLVTPDATGVWAEPAFWERIPMEADGWSGPGWSRGLPTSQTLVCFRMRQVFSVPAGEIAAARWYHATPGLAYAWVGGQPVLPEQLWGPLACDERKSLPVEAADVTETLRGCRTVVVGLAVASGYATPWHASTRHPVPAVRGRLLLRMTDGREHALDLDGEGCWKPSPTRLSGTYYKHKGFGGEHEDEREEEPGWLEADFPAADWLPLEAVPGPAGRLVGPLAEPHRIRERLPAVSLEMIRPDTWLADFGRILTGRVNVRFGLKDNWATTRQVRLRYFDQWPIRDDQPRRNHFGQVDSCEFHPDSPPGRQVAWSPRWHPRSFRYVEIEYNCRNRPDDLETVIAEVCHNDLPDQGRFSCGEPQLDWLAEAAGNTFAALAINGTPTDCVHRERDGWGAEAEANMRQACYRFRIGALMRKFLRDWRDAQDPDGRLPYYAPWRLPSDFSPAGGPYYASAPVQLAWEAWCFTGDRRFVTDNLPMIERWCRYLMDRCPDGLMDFWLWAEKPSHVPERICFLGDWLSPGRMEDDTESNRLFNTLHAILTLKHALRLAEIAEADPLAELARREIPRLTEAVRERIDPETGQVGTGRQPYPVLALAAGVVDGDLRDRVVGALLKRIREKDKGHLDTGVLASTYLLQVLAVAGEIETALDLLLQPDYPGVGPFRAAGMQVLPEVWTGAESNCHASFPGLAGFLYHDLAGVQPDPAGPGFRVVRFAPGLTRKLPGAGATLSTDRGPVACHWSWQDAGREAYTVRLMLPLGSTARLSLPGQPERDLTSGEHRVSGFVSG